MSGRKAPPSIGSRPISVTLFIGGRWRCAFGLRWGRHCPCDHWAWTISWLTMVVRITSGDLCPDDTGWNFLGSGTWLFRGSPLSLAGLRAWVHSAIHSGCRLGACWSHCSMRTVDSFQLGLAKMRPRCPWLLGGLSKWGFGPQRRYEASDLGARMQP